MRNRIEITFGAIVSLCLLGWLNLKICWYLILSAAVHEIFHILLLRCNGICVKSVKLSFGSALIEHAPCGYWKEMICAAAGPVSNLLFGFCVMRKYSDLACINFLLGIGNLLPIYPLDGGRILHAILASFVADEKLKYILKLAHITTCAILMIISCWITVELQAGIWPIFVVLVLLLRIDKAGNSENEKSVAFPPAGS